MKRIQTSKRNAARLTATLVLAMLIAIVGFHSLKNDSSRVAAAVVVERATSENVDSVAADKPAVTDPRAADSAATLVENRMTDEAREAVRALGGGEASFYGAGFAGRPTANGERFNPSEMTAAHRTLPFGSKIRVTNTQNGRSVVVRVNDRGPYAHNRVIDLSRGAAERIGMIQSGTADVRLELIS